MLPADSHPWAWVLGEEKPGSLRNGGLPQDPRGEQAAWPSLSVRVSHRWWELMARTLLRGQDPTHLCPGGRSPPSTSRILLGVTPLLTAFLASGGGGQTIVSPGPPLVREGGL